MNHYFMPKVEGLTSHLTLANFPCRDGEASWPSKQFIYATWTDGEKWNVRCVTSVEPGQTALLSDQHVPSDCPNDILPFYFLYPDKVANTLDQLIISDHMDTSPIWRSNIQLCSATTRTGYQGEYPKEMLFVKKGTMVSIGPLVQKDENIKTKMIFIIMRRNPKVEAHKITLATLKTRRVLSEETVFSNRSTVIDLSELDHDPTDPLCVFSKETTGIPLFLSHDLEFSQLSFEHNLPATEMLVFGNRRLCQEKMKTWWLKSVYQEK
jgi:hypothetical protein